MTNLTIDDDILLGDISILYQSKVYKKKTNVDNRKMIVCTTSSCKLVPTVKLTTGNSLTDLHRQL